MLVLALMYVRVSRSGRESQYTHVNAWPGRTSSKELLEYDVPDVVTFDSLGCIQGAIREQQRRQLAGHSKNNRNHLFPVAAS